MTRRLPSSQARAQLASLLRELGEVEEPSDSIADRAVRIGAYNRDAAVLVPVVDFEQALELEQAVEDIALELAVAERLAQGPGRTKTLEEVARELGLAGELGLE